MGIKSSDFSERPSTKVHIPTGLTQLLHLWKLHTSNPMQFYWERNSSRQGCSSLLCEGWDSLSCCIFIASCSPQSWLAGSIRTSHHLGTQRSKSSTPTYIKMTFRSLLLAQYSSIASYIKPQPHFKTLPLQYFRRVAQETQHQTQN